MVIRTMQWRRRQALSRGRRLQRLRALSHPQSQPAQVHALLPFATITCHDSTSKTATELKPNYIMHPIYMSIS